MKRALALLLLSLLLTLLLLSSGCDRSKPSPSPKRARTESPVAGQGVLMLGRSVMAGWFSHWGSDTSSPVEREGFTLYYGELAGPPDIASSAEARVDECSDKAPIVFFKLCFVDFEGGSRTEARENLARNKGYVEKVYQDIVKERGKKLIVGNALPMVETYTTSDLVWNHREYNKWLNEFAQAHSGEVYVFDQYGILTDSEGNLKKEYATDAEDSHPDDAAYSALDQPFFSLVDTMTHSDGISCSCVPNQPVNTTLLRTLGRLSRGY